VEDREGRSEQVLPGRTALHIARESTGTEMTRTRAQIKTSRASLGSNLLLALMNLDRLFFFFSYRNKSME
jgi:hypothetical protein